MLPALLVILGIFVLIFVCTIPVRKKKSAKVNELKAMTGEVLEEVPVKTPKFNGHNSYIDVNYVLFYVSASGPQSYDIKQVKGMELTWTKTGNRYYYLALKDAEGNTINKALVFASMKQAEKMQSFIQKYIDKIASVG